MMQQGDKTEIPTSVTDPHTDGHISDPLKQPILTEHIYLRPVLISQSHLLTA
jgi:hypothetical protein